MQRRSRAERWLTALNGLSIFHPARWPHGEIISRCTALVIITVFLAVKVYRFDDFPQTFEAARRFYSAILLADGTPFYTPMAILVLWSVKLAVWIVESAIFIGYMAAYLSRGRAVSVADGFMETAFPVIVAGLPVLMAMAPYNLPGRIPLASQAHLPYYLTVMAMILIGGLLNLAGLMTLRRAFAIMTEARRLIRNGLFRYIRHPIYTGHFIMFSGSLLLRLHSYTVVLFLLFCAGQVWRARIEERKLIRTFPQYGAYRRDTGMFWPKGLFTFSRQPVGKR